MKQAYGSNLKQEPQLGTLLFFVATSTVRPLASALSAKPYGPSNKGGPGMT